MITEKDKESLINRLMTKPKMDKGKNATRFYNPIKDRIHQADIVNLSNDKGFHSLLVVVDIATRKVDAQPLRSKGAKSVLNALLQIYQRDILDPPEKLEVDNGSEFKAEFQDELRELGIFLKRNKPGRHRQMALVERANQTLVTKIYKEQMKKELATGKTKRLWLHLYRKIINDMNKNASPSKIIYDDPVCEGSSCELLPIGLKVLAPLEEPRDIEGNKLHGKFRKPDLKYSLKIRTIKEFLIKDNSPPLYLLNGDYGPLEVEPVAYTKNQLLVLKDKDIELLKKFQ
jgi:transposase InsO family protein